MTSNNAARQTEGSRGEADSSAPSQTNVALSKVGRAFAHELRIRIVLVLAEEHEASPISIATRLQEPLSNVSYHVRYLAQLGAIELQRMEPRRGALEHFYSLVPAIRLALPLIRQVGRPNGTARDMARPTSHRIST
jgi:DNA-binding transcriptional ArsR family regulator